MLAFIPVESIFNGLFLLLVPHPIHIFLSSYSFFFPVLFLKSICLIFKRKNADNLPIYKYFETSFAFNWYWNSRGPCFGWNFFQVSISFAFERTRVSLPSVISTSHFSRLIYYVVMWAEFTCIELLTTKKPEWKRRAQRFAVEDCEQKAKQRRPKWFELVEIFKSASEIGIHLLDRLPEASDQSFFIIFHLQIPLQSTFEILQLMASSEIASNGVLGRCQWLSAKNCLFASISHQRTVISQCFVFCFVLYRKLWLQHVSASRSFVTRTFLIFEMPLL